MYNKKIQTKQRILLVLISFLFVALYTFIGIAGHEVFSEKDRLSRVVDIDAMGEHLEPFYFEINNFSKVVADDFLFLSRISSISNLANGDDGEVRSDTVSHVQKDFLEFLENSSAYYQIRYINTAGQEIARAQFDGSSITLTPDAELQDKAQKTYVTKTMELQKGELFLSPLELNVEHGEMENRGTSARPQYVPVLRFATPIFSDIDELKGILVLNVYADYFLSNIKSASHKDEEVFLIDQSGQYLVHPDSRKEFGAQLESGANFAIDYPEMSDRVLSYFQKRRLESEKSIFVLRHIFPATASFALSKGSMNVWKGQPDRNFFWVLVSIVDKEALLHDNGIFENFIFFMGFIGLLVALIVGVLVIILEIARRKTLK